MLIGRLLLVAGNRLTASLRLRSAGTGNKFQLESREKSTAGESNGESSHTAAEQLKDAQWNKQKAGTVCCAIN